MNRSTSPHRTRDSRPVSGAEVSENGGTSLDFALLKLRAQQAQSRHATEAWTLRRRKLHRLHSLVVERAEVLAGLVAGHRGCTPAEALATELIPLADAVKFNARRFARLLAPKRLGTVDRPGWLIGVDSEVRRQPLGLILVIAPGNYPLYLAGVQSVQAIAAGNAVWLKPAPGAAEILSTFRELLVQAGFGPDLIQVLPESIEAGRAAIAAGVDKVVFTGSADTGRRVLEQLAPHLTPAVMELSGCDAVFLRHDADLELAARAVAFGLTINRGATCIAPRRVFVPRQHLAGFTQRLRDELASRRPINLDAGACQQWLPRVKDALGRGAFIVAGTLHAQRVTGPLVLGGVTPEMPLLQEDAFAPVAGIVAVHDDEEALVADARCTYALGASVFGRNRPAACQLAGRIRAGSVVINDLIAPTADPRLPFGGLGRSGFGVTRGAEGLLELTAPKVVISNRTRLRLHYRPFREEDTPLFRTLLELGHGASLRSRLLALLRALRLFRSSPHPDGSNHRTHTNPAHHEQSL